MDPFITRVQGTVLAQLRPMVIALAKRGRLDDKALDAIEVEAARLFLAASEGVLELTEIRRTPMAYLGALDCQCRRIPSQDNRP